MKKHLPRIALLLLCVLRPFARVFNMLVYLAAYLDESAGFLIDLAALVWGIELLSHRLKARKASRAQ